MSLGEDLRTFILTDASIAAIVGTAVCQNHVPQDVTDDFIWFQRSGTEPHTILNPGASEKTPLTEFFDVECVSTNADTVLDTTTGLIDLVRTKLQYHSGTMGTSTVKAVFVEDHDDGYVPKSVHNDDGFHVGSLSVKIIGA